MLIRPRWGSSECRSWQRLVQVFLRYSEKPGVSQRSHSCLLKMVRSRTCLKSIQVANTIGEAELSGPRATYEPCLASMGGGGIDHILRPRVNVSGELGAEYCSVARDECGVDV